MLTKADIDWLKSELVPALSGQVKKDLSERLDWIATMLDKQSGNLQSIETELTLIRGSLETHTTDHSTLIKRIEKVEKHLHLTAAA
ncbi:MAG: hypothetical protein NTY06_00575 [Candidatus Gottesmanbacteria bacterium]|nr:hypothetical protein [Candidatus Gottesmanbacteria bacterium]